MSFRTTAVRCPAGRAAKPRSSASRRTACCSALSGTGRSGTSSFMRSPNRPRFRSAFTAVFTTIRCSHVSNRASSRNPGSPRNLRRYASCTTSSASYRSPTSRYASAKARRCVRCTSSSRARRSPRRHRTRSSRVTKASGTWTRSSPRWLPFREAHHGLALPDGVFRVPLPFHSHPHVEHCGARLRIDRLHSPLRHDHVVHEHWSPELDLQTNQHSGVPQPVGQAVRELSHREHPVRDDARETHGSGEVVVLMQRVLVAGSVGVRLDLPPKDVGGAAGDLVSDEQILEAWVQLRHQAPRSIISVSIVRNPFPAFCRIEAILERTVSASPIRKGRRHSYSCSAWTTSVKSRPSSASPTMNGITANSAAVANVGGTMPHSSPIAAQNRFTRSGSTVNVASG